MVWGEGSTGNCSWGPQRCWNTKAENSTTGKQNTRPCFDVLFELTGTHRFWSHFFSCSWAPKAAALGQVSKPWLHKDTSTWNSHSLEKRNKEAPNARTLEVGNVLYGNASILGGTSRTTRVAPDAKILNSQLWKTHRLGTKELCVQWVLWPVVTPQGAGARLLMLQMRHWRLREGKGPTRGHKAQRSSLCPSLPFVSPTTPQCACISMFGASGL